MFTRALPLALLAALALACSSEVEPAAAPEGWTAYGAGIEASSGFLPMADLMSRAGELDGQKVLFEGEVREVCQMSGCWMTFDTGEGDLRVEFDPYGTYMPMDIAGRTVRVEGVFELAEISESDARHYLEDAGKSEEAAAIKGPQKGYRLVASGALLADA